MQAEAAERPATGSLSLVVALLVVIMRYNYILVTGWREDRRERAGDGSYHIPQKLPVVE